MSKGRQGVVTVGSVHMDLIATADRLPGPGESITGGQFTMAPGGKAGNQATQIARLGLPSYLVTRLGNDLFGRSLLSELESSGVSTQHVAIDSQVSTGASTIFSVRGDYSSIIAPGAAGQLTGSDIQNAESSIAGSSALLLQLELPVERALTAAKIARKHHVMVVLNASPAPDTIVPALSELLAATSMLVVNRVEAARLSGYDGNGKSLARALSMRFGIDRVVVTLGPEGAVAVNGADCWLQPAFPASVLDTVGAGDAFLATMVASLIDETDFPGALRAGAAAGALAVGRSGGQASLPSRAEIDDYLVSNCDVALTRRLET